MRTWSYLVIHHSASSPDTRVADIDAWHRARGWSGIGYHYVIERDSAGRGHLKRGRPDTKAGAHAGVALYNSKGIGLCVAGNFDREPVSEALYADVLGAVLHLCRKYGIPAGNVLGHRDCKATACPGGLFPLKRLKEDVRRGLG